MSPADRVKLIEILSGVHDFYGKDLSRFAIAVWEQACDTFDVQQVTKALSAHLMDAERGQFMPKPADIVRQLQGTNTDRALLAWGKTLDALQRAGAYTDVVFDDGLIHTVIEDLGGWVKLCRSETDELGYLQTRFCNSYRAYANRGDVRFPARLRGAHSLENAARGFKTAPPVLIGNPEKAARVLAIGSNEPKTQITHITGHVQDLQRIGSAA